MPVVSHAEQSKKRDAARKSAAQKPVEPMGAPLDSALSQVVESSSVSSELEKHPKFDKFKKGENKP